MYCRRIRAEPIPDNPSSPSPLARFASPDSLFHHDNGPQPPSLLTQDGRGQEGISRASPSPEDAPDVDDSRWLRDFDPDVACDGESKEELGKLCSSLRHSKADSVDEVYGYVNPPVVDEPVVTVEVLEQRKKDEETLKAKRHHNPHAPESIPLVDYSEIRTLPICCCGAHE